MIKVEFVEVDAQTVVDYWLQGYQPKKGQEIYGKEAFYDPHKGKFIIKLTIKEEDAGS